jgi:hypothetical protein
MSGKMFAHAHSPSAVTETYGYLSVELGDHLGVPMEMSSPLGIYISNGEWKGAVKRTKTCTIKDQDSASNPVGRLIVSLSDQHRR